MKRILSLLVFCFAVIAPSCGAEATAPDYRVVLADAVLEQDASKQSEMVQQLVDSGDDLVERGLIAWRLSELYLYESPGGTNSPIVLDTQLDTDGKAKGIRIRDGKFITDASGKELHFAVSDLTPADNTSKLRRAIKTTLDLFALAHPLPKMRRDTATKLGQQRNPEFLPNFEARLKVEKNAEAIKALHEAIALTLTASDDPAVRNAAIQNLGDMRSVNGVSLLRDMEQECKANPGKFGPETPKTLRSAVQSIDNYLWWGNLVGTLFRGLSLSAVLLVAALGLAITFGLMNVINMAHGEIMAVGAYTAFALQGIFGGGFLFSLFGKTVSVGGMGLKGGAFDLYFIVALVASFVTGALLGLILERTVIRFLYKRPLESLLATWGVSLILQQLFRHTFGAANVDVSAPSFLTGSVVVNDVGFAYNRIFIICFAVAIVYGTYLLLTKTSLGLQIRAVMQNRAMASCIGVRTDRVNMMTFALGSGLAGMAGACLSQIANVGPSLGQSYVIDCFMVVVLGGVGNIVGTVTASGGVGVANQILEPWMGAVLGKIAVLVAIILFLQWRPNGIFVTRSRSLDG